MTRKKDSSSTGYSHVARTALQEGTSRTQEIHQAIAGKSFAILQQIPLVSVPARLVQRAHDAIAGSVYAAIRHAGGGLLDIAGSIEKHSAAKRTNTQPGPPSRLASGVRSALNAAFGDHLADTNSVLAIPMRFYHAGHAIPLEREALACAYPAGGDLLCVFIHGLGFDEHCWENGKIGGKSSGKIAGKGDSDIDMPRQLAADLGYTALTLRYNSGLPIAENGAHLALLLDELLEAWPQPVHELLIIGHSMGGLLARSACTQAAAVGLDWCSKTSMVICLGSPHLGSPLEKLGQLTTSALRRSAITEPLARIAARRSQGIQDLRHGLGNDAPIVEHIAWRFIGASLVDDPNNPLGEIIGDGLVTLGSATAHALSGDVQSVRLGGLGHMALLKDARVYAQIRAWLAQRA